MRNTVSENEIENLLKDLSPISSGERAHALENSKKTNWNSISQIIDTYKEKDMTEIIARKGLFNFRFRKIHLAFGSLMIFAIALGLVLYNKTGTHSSKEVAIDNTKPTQLPTATSTITPKKEIKSIDDFKPIAAQKLQELTDISDKQLEDIMKGIDDPANFVPQNNSRIYYSKIILQGNVENYVSMKSHTKVTSYKAFNESSSYVVEYWSGLGRPTYFPDELYGKEIITQGNKYLKVLVNSPYQSISYNSDDNVYRKTTVTDPEVLKESARRRQKEQPYQSNLSYEAQILKDLLSGYDSELLELKNEADFTILNFKRDKHYNSKVKVILDKNNKISSLKTEFYNKDWVLDGSHETVELKVLDFDEKLFDFDPSVLPNDIKKEEKQVTWEYCGGGLMTTIGCPK